MGSDLSSVNEDRLANMATGGAWRRPRMKVYDYNQEFGGNYYQPMIQYINHKDMYGPFHKKQDVYLPHTAEVRSNKYTNKEQADKKRKHLVMIEACNDEFNYHHKLFGDVSVDRNMKFHAPQLVKDYVNQIRRI